jgi:hypothetical protein
MIDVQAPVPNSNVALGSTHVPSAPDNALPGAPNHMIPSPAPTVSHAADPLLLSPVANSTPDESTSIAVPMISASTDLSPQRIFLGPCAGIICGPTSTDLVSSSTSDASTDWDSKNKDVH